MKYEELINAFGAVYLKGSIDTLAIEQKFYMIDNTGTGPASPLPVPKGPIRYPVRITFSFCIYCKQGTLSVRVQQKDYTVGPGGMLIIFAEQILEYAGLTDDGKVIFFAIDSDYVMTEVRGRYRNTFRHWLVRSKQPVMIQMRHEDAENFEMLCRSVKYIAKNSASEFTDGIISGFTAIFGNLLLNWSPQQAENGTPGHESCNAEKVLVRFQSDVHNFSSRFRSVSYYARRQNLSPRHFSRLIKEASGQKPVEIIRDYVILEAKSLLISGRYSVRGTAEKLGFRNDSFFNRYFSSATGVTPGEYIKTGAV